MRATTVVRAAARIGPNPWIQYLGSSLPRIGQWGAGMFFFLTWPYPIYKASKVGLYSI